MNFQATHCSPGSNADSAHVDSYWAGSSRHTANFSSLVDDIETDVVILGAGFTGLSVAYHLHELGFRCVVLDANQVGWGASGRNGGMVVPRYKLTFPELEKKYGAETALKMHHLAHDAVNTLERIITECNLSCGFGRYGHIAPVATTSGVSRFEADVAWLGRHAQDHVPRMLDSNEVARATGTSLYRAGYMEPRGAGINPLEYCQALANTLSGRGVDVFCRSAGRQWVVEPNGIVVYVGNARVKAKYLVIATNAYTEFTQAGDLLKRRIVPVTSAVIATAPLSAQQRASVLPDGNLATDAKRLTNYYRVLADGRFLFGGRGGSSARPSSSVIQRLYKSMCSMFPGLRDISVEFHWSGQVAVTLDSLPHMGQLNSRVYYSLGYNGRGLALSTILGRNLARAIAGETVTVGPISDSGFSAIPFHGLRAPAKRAVILYKQFLDSLGL